MTPHDVLSLTRRSALSRGLATAASVAVPAVFAQPPMRRVRFGISLNEDHPQGLAVKKFAEVAAARSKDRIQVELFASSRLGSDVVMCDKLRQGQLDMAAADTSTLVRFSKPFSLINFPFLLNKEEDADLLLDSEFGKKLLATLPASQLVGLAFWENGFRNLSNSKRAVTRRQDLDSLRVRVMQSNLFSDTFATLGAVPLQLPFDEVYASLRDGKVDAQENPLITIYNARFYEVQKHLTLSRHAYSAWAVLAGTPFWDSLTAQEQAILRFAAEEATRYERQTIRAANAEMVSELKRKGMLVTEFAREETPLIRMATRRVVDKYAQELGPEWVKQLYLQLAVIEYRKQHASR